MAVKTKALPSPVLLSTCLHGKHVRPIELNRIAAFTISILTQSIPTFRLMEHPEEDREKGGGQRTQNDRNVE